MKLKLWLPVLAVGLIGIGALWIFEDQRQVGSDAPPAMSDVKALSPQDSSSPRSDGTPPNTPGAERHAGVVTDKDIVDRQKPVPGKLSDVMAELVPRAERGDAEAAYQLFIKINDCKWALEGSSSASSTADESVKAAEAAWLTETLAKLEDCDGLTEDQINSRAKWLTIAADGGDPLAQLTYSISSELILGDASQMMANPRAVEDFKAKSLRFLLALADRGNVSAILRLRTAYSAGILVPQDRVRAYAYSYLATLITGTGQNITQSLGDSLTPEQIHQGQQIAITLHRRCCG